MYVKYKEEKQIHLTFKRNILGINVLVNIKAGLKFGFLVSNAFSPINKDTRLFG
jgi:hypothetical protein